MSSWIVTAVCLLGSVIGAAPAAAQTTRVSVAADGTQANGESTHAAISANGRYVAFTSAATNLVPGDTNGTLDVFVKDLQTNAIVRVSVATGGMQHAFDSGFDGVDISADGNVIVFTSRAPFDAVDTNACDAPAGQQPSCPDIYVHDRTANTTTRVSVASDGTQGNNASATPQVSDDGRYVVFASDASSLGFGDTNQVTDVFLHDRATHTTTRVSVSSTGVQGDFYSRAPVISGDGGVIGFISDARTLTSVPDPFVCSDTLRCDRPFVYDRLTQETTRLDPTDWEFPTNPYLGVSSLALDSSGARAALAARIEGLGVDTRVLLYDRAIGRSYAYMGSFATPQQITMSDNGRFISLGSSFDRLNASGLATVDLLTGQVENSTGMNWNTSFGSYRTQPRPSLSADGRLLVYATVRPETGDTNDAVDVYVLNRDIDGDGLLTRWEQEFGLNPDDAGDATGDADTDGATNLQEFQAGTHPNGRFKKYLAEGAANAFFRTTIAVANPNATPASASVRLLGGNGQTTSITRSLGAFGRASVELMSGGTIPDSSFAAVIESDQPVAVDRTMRWDIEPPASSLDGRLRFYGAHAETASAAPSTTWFLAEGATHGNFDLFYLLQNATNTPAHVNVTYLRPLPLPPITKPYTVGANSRLTIYVDTEGPELAAADLSAAIVSDQPIMVERAMYFSTPTQPFAAGHDGAGVTTPALKWFLAEGATGSFFDLYVLVANPGAQDSELKVTYLTPDGAPFSKTYTAGRQSRLTIPVDQEDPRLLDTPVSMIVESTNGQPIVVERAMWWPSPNWYEGHLAAGATTTGTRWAVADGLSRTNFPDGAILDETYILIANTSPAAGTATLTLLEDGQPSPRRTTVPLPPNSRVSVSITTTFSNLSSLGYGVLVESSGPEIVVERAMYFTWDGVPWSAGTAVLATKLDP